MTRLFAALALAFLMASGAARAQETITAFHADIALSGDGGMLVTETIDAVSAADRIKRGLYRDIPLTSVDADGRLQRVDFNVVSVRRDGESEPWHSQSIPNGVRIFTGDADVFLKDGPHRFEITYQTARQIRFFKDHDELYWNVTGNGWDFPIGKASATVTLPSGVRAQALDLFTGPAGSRNRNARAVDNGGSLAFSTTRSLGPNEGLTILVKLPKGAIAPPSATRENLWWLRDNLATILALAGLFIVTGYYGRMWLKVGRDPPRGVIVPRWDVPDNMSPALVNYIDNRGFSGAGWTALSAAALSLAVAGYVTLEDRKSALVIARTAKPVAPALPSGETALMAALAREGGTLIIDTAHGAAVKQAGEDFRSAMEKEHRGKFYKANALYVVGGVLLSALFLAAIALFGNLHEAAGEVVIIPVVASIFVAIVASRIGRSYRSDASLPKRIIGILFIAFFGFVMLSGLSGVLAFLAETALVTGQLPLLIAIGGIMLVNLLFFHLMGAPTPLGSRMMDAIDGLRQYLTLAEASRMNMAGVPVMSPQHFETLLPYAVALGVEKPWSNTFAHWLESATASAAYQPMWYTGHGGSIGDRFGRIGGSLADTMTASLPAPPSTSSSGFSSGSSGGGGGGGGGGGW